MTAKLAGDKAEAGVFDNAKIKNLVPDFDCRKNFRQGIAECMAWFQQDPKRRQPNPEIQAIYEKIVQR